MRVSENGRYLTDNRGEPFFYLADTAWQLFHKPTLDEARDYLRARQEQGFTVIFPVVLWGNPEPPTSLYGGPFDGGEPTRPNERFFRRVDRIVDFANELGLSMALIAVWGRYVAPGPDAVITPANAGAYGEFLGRRYRDRDVVWVLGGDRNPPEGDDQLIASYRNLAAGIKQGDGGSHLMTYHPTSVWSSSEWFHDETWLDFNMWQTSTQLEVDYCKTLLRDYNRTPMKPFLDGETRYEHSHQFFHPASLPGTGVRMTPKRVRQAAYYAVLCGALGHTYGCRDVWSFHTPADRPPDRDVDLHWREAIHLPAAEQMRHLRRLFTDYPWHALVPEQGNGLVAQGSLDRDLRVQGAVARDHSFALAYLPEPMDVLVDVGRVDGPAVDAWWFEPMTGKYSFIRRFHDEGKSLFRAADVGTSDRVLVLRTTGEIKTEQ